MSKMDPPINRSNMVIQEVAVDAVTPYEKNPRKIPKEAIERSRLKEEFEFYRRRDIRAFGEGKEKND